MVRLVLTSLQAFSLALGFAASLVLSMYVWEGAASADRSTCTLSWCQQRRGMWW